VKALSTSYSESLRSHRTPKRGWGLIRSVPLFSQRLSRRSFSPSPAIGA